MDFIFANCMNAFEQTDHGLAVKRGNIFKTPEM
jgi:hypothetical protein